MLYLIRISLLSSVFFLFLYACGTGSQQVPPVDLPLKPLLLFIIDDRSGSAITIRKPEKKHYSQLVDLVAKSGGEIFVCLAGNPLPEQLMPYSAAFDTSETINSKTRMDLAALARQRNKAVADSNALRKAVFMEQIDRCLFQYQPRDSQDITINLDRCFEYASKVLSSPRFQERQYRRVVVIISDGHHEDRSGKRIPLPSTARLSISDSTRVKIFLLGWDADKSCFNGLPLTESGSMEDLLQEIKRL